MGGVKDVDSSYETIDEVLEVFPERFTGNATIQIVDRDNWIVVKEYQG